jgi:hypothetical protein
MGGRRTHRLSELFQDRPIFVAASAFVPRSEKLRRVPHKTLHRLRNRTNNIKSATTQKHFNMAIIYALISREKTVLAEHTATSGKSVKE